ncbi:MAG: GHKL domain-containing protein [Syntrophomonadaceae bacterium]|jgi:two-component system sensor histidine kinase AgrC|nr:GHKL domain-containing protein [Syntrophomonadaceae bacterium]
MNNNKPILAITTILFETVFIAIILITIGYLPNIEPLKAVLPFANLVIVLLSGFAVISIRQVEQYSRQIIEAQLLKEHLNNIEDLVNSFNSQRHEHTRHIQTVQAMLYLDEVEQARDYLDGVAEQYWEIQDLVFVGNPALTALVNSKRKLAETKNINFDFAVKCDIKEMAIPPWDLCSIIGNLVDNALEASLKGSQPRRVSLEIKYDNSHYGIYVYNTGPKIPKQQENLLFAPGFSTSGSAGRGFGLYIVKRLVGKYGGTIRIVTHPRTTFIISFPDRRRINDQASVMENSLPFRAKSAN